MKIVRTNLPPALTVLLIVLAVFFVIFIVTILIPVLIIAGFCWLIVYAVTGRAPSPVEFYRRNKARRRARNYEGPFERQDDSEETDRADGDDTIECEVISARTIDENGREIR